MEKEACKSAAGLYNVLKEKFRPLHNEITLSLQYRKLHKKENGSVQEWKVGSIKAAECNYKGHDRWLKEQFNNDIKLRNYRRNYKRANSSEEHE